MAFLVNAVATERAVYTTTLLARAAVLRGHQVGYVDLTDLAVGEDGVPAARVRWVDGSEPDPATLLSRARATAPRPLALAELDVLMIRCEPSFELLQRPWAQPVGWLFGELARRAGVLVLSDPRGLALAGPDKYYTLRFPAEHRPPTLVTRDLAEVRDFAAGRLAGIVLKPLHGGAGESVFWVRRGDPNLTQIFTAVAQRGYVVAQEYLPEVAAGCTRLFLLGGEPLVVGGKVAALRHLASGTDIRTNYEVSATVAPAEPDADTLAVARAAGAHLAADGMFLVGLDLVGGLILEANLHSPGGLRGAERLTGADFSGAVVEAVQARLPVGRAVV